MNRKIFAILIGTVFTSSLFAQVKDEHLLKAISDFNSALIDANTEKLNALVMDELSYGHSSGVIESKQEFIEKIVSGKSDFVSIDITGQTGAIIANTAIVRHHLHARTNDNNTPGEVKLHILLVWQKNDGKWKLLARQAVRPK